MSDDDWKKIHEAEEEARQAKRGKWDWETDREPDLTTLKLAARICLWGLVPPVLIVLVWMLTTIERHTDMANRMGAFLCFTAGFGLIHAPLGVTCGFLAHRICRNSSVPERWMAIALALLVDVTVFGWLLWLLLPAQ